MLGGVIGRDPKGNLSVLICAAAIPVAFLNSWLAQALRDRRLDVAHPRSTHRDCLGSVGQLRLELSGRVDQRPLFTLDVMFGVSFSPFCERQQVAYSVEKPRAGSVFGVSGGR